MIPHTDSHSSLRRLPVELWATIFEFCLPEEGFVLPGTSCAPLLLGNVCREWRDIALSTPALWAFLTLQLELIQIPKPIHPDFDTSALGSPTASVQGLKEWISRSRTYPLAISLVTSNRISHTQADTAKLEYILANADRHRWAVLRLDVNYPLLVVIFPCPSTSFSLSSASASTSTSASNSNSDPPSFPALHTLTLKTYYPLKPLPLTPTSFPALRHISYDDPVCISSRFIIPWSQIIHISSHGLANTSTHLERLRACPQIRSYDMTLFFADTPTCPTITNTTITATTTTGTGTGANTGTCTTPKGPPRPLILPHLHTLVITAWIPNALPAMLDNLVLPSLRHIELRIAQQVLAGGQGGGADTDTDANTDGNTEACGLPRFPTDAFERLVERSASASNSASACSCPSRGTGGASICQCEGDHDSDRSRPRCDGIMEASNFESESDDSDSGRSAPFQLKNIRVKNLELNEDEIWRLKRFVSSSSSRG